MTASVNEPELPPVEQPPPAEAPSPAPAPDLPAPPPVVVAPLRPMALATKVMWVVAALGTALRLWFVLTVHRPIDFDYSDMHSYVEGATWMAKPGYHPSIFDFYYPTGSAFFIHIWLRIFGMKTGWIVAGAVQGLMSGAEIPLIYFATRRFFSNKVALASAILFATHYLSIGYAGFFMSENYLAIAIISACALYVPERPGKLLAAGIALGLGAWAKSQAILLAPMWSLVLWRRGQRRGAVLLSAGALAIVIPVSIWVSLSAGKATFISFNGGQTFALAHCPIKEIWYSDPKSHTGAMFTLPVQNQRFERGDPEADWGSAHYTEPFVDSNYYMREGFKCIARYPKHYLRQVFYHVVDTFCGPPWSITMPWPDSHTRFRMFSLSSNLFLCFIISPLAFLGLWWRRREEAMWVYFALPLGSVLITAVLFHGDSRFRCPYDFGLFIGASAAVEYWWRRRREKKSPPVAAPEPPSVATPAAELPPAAAPAMEPPPSGS